MKFENLPAELLFDILSYLSPLDVFYSFSNLNNQRIKCVIYELYSIRQDDYASSSNLNISLVHIPIFMYNFAVSNVLAFHSNIICSLALSNDRTPGQINAFLEKYSFKYDFPCLKTLRLIQPLSDELNTIINDLSHVEKIDIQSKDMYSCDLNIIHKLFYEKPSIKHCCLNQFQHNFILNKSYSHIKIFDLNSCDYLCFLNILNHFSLLEQLSINMLTMPTNVVLSSINLMKSPILMKSLKLRAFSIPFDHFQVLCPYFESIEIFSLAILCDEGFDYVNSDKWRMIITNYWPLLKTFQLYSELWHLTANDFDELYPQLLSFKTNSFWLERKMKFQTDFYRDESALHLIFYSLPYPDRKFSNEWGYRTDMMANSNSIDSYKHINRLLLTIYHNKQTEYELNKSFYFFPNVDTLTIRFEQHISSSLFICYMKSILNFSTIKHLILNDKRQNIETLHRFILCLPNLSKLTITNNHRGIIKDLFKHKNQYFLSLLTDRIKHLNLLYDGVLTYEIMQRIEYSFSHLKSFTACLPHFEDFRDTIPAFIRHMKSLEYLHINLEGENDKKNFCTQDMYDWFHRHNVTVELKLYIDTYTNSIHIWL